MSNVFLQNFGFCAALILILSRLLNGINGSKKVPQTRRYCTVLGSPLVILQLLLVNGGLFFHYFKGKLRLSCYIIYLENDSNENILEVLKASLHKAQKKRKAPCTPVTK